MFNQKTKNLVNVSSASGTTKDVSVYVSLADFENGTPFHSFHRIHRIGQVGHYPATVIYSAIHANGGEGGQGMRQQVVAADFDSCGDCRCLDRGLPPSAISY